ncbi:Acetyl-CoA acetyltransferase, cytosolic [Cichlidogyrus casuarinus]|uniref:Acetyl-CoA acetyltransferase, cytosolic n=1 Tax=Cichlidogyrus casuarinus TaxID=1844966 RepID=A0ABD2QM87_9PLAT
MSQSGSPCHSSLAPVPEENSAEENSFETPTGFSASAPRPGRTSVTGPSVLQIGGQSQAPTQYLFRHCGAFVNNIECLEPVVNWSPFTRCARHTLPENVWPELNPSFKADILSASQSKISLGLAYNREVNPLILKTMGVDIKPIKMDEQYSSCTVLQYAADDILIVAAARSPVGKFRGGLAKLEAHEIGTQVLASLLSRTLKHPVPGTRACVTSPEDVKKLDQAPAKDQVTVWMEEHLDCVIMGQVFTAGCGQNPVRQAATGAGVPFEVPSWGVNMLCGSGLLAVGLAYDRLRLQKGRGFAIAGGQESMTKARNLLEKPLSKESLQQENPIDSMIKDGLTDAFCGLHMGHTAENIALKYGLSREDQDLYAINSQNKYQAAKGAGKFDAEMVQISIPGAERVAADEHPRAMGADAPEKLGALKAAFARDGFTNSVTAANSSGINDGAAALFLARQDALVNLPQLVKENAELCRIVGFEQVGCHPETMGLGPIYAVKRLLKSINWDLDSVHRFELNEAFAAQSLAVVKELGVDQQRVNVNGGAIAIGHPLGCSGARILVSLVHELARIRSTVDAPVRGVAALCVGGGMGIALAVEKL